MAIHFLTVTNCYKIINFEILAAYAHMKVSQNKNKNISNQIKQKVQAIRSNSHHHKVLDIWMQLPPKSYVTNFILGLKSRTSSTHDADICEQPVIFMTSKDEEQSTSLFSRIWMLVSVTRAQ